MRKRPFEDRGRGVPDRRQPERPFDPLDAISVRPVSRQSQQAAALRQFQEALRTLTFNSKPIINQLTMMAEEARRLQHGPAKAVSDALLTHLLHCPAGMKLPALYTIDSVLKNVGEPYRTHFIAIDPPSLPHSLQAIMSEVAPETAGEMHRVFLTWRGILPAPVMAQMEKSFPEELPPASAGKIAAALSMPPLPPTGQLLELLMAALQAVRQDSRAMAQQAHRIKNLFAHLRMKGDLPLASIDRMEQLVREDRLHEACDVAVASSLSVNSDLLNSLKDLVPAATDAALEEPREEPSVDLFSHRSIMALDPRAHAVLYSMPLQCRQCGLRFPAQDGHESGKKALQDHLDAHFKKNIRLKDRRGTTVQIRGWFLPQKEWVGYALTGGDEVAAVKTAEVSAIFEQPQPRTEDKVEEVAAIVAEEHDGKCPACLDRLDVRWHPGREEWVYTDAAKQEGTGAVFHRHCL